MYIFSLKNVFFQEYVVKEVNRIISGKEDLDSEAEVIIIIMFFIISIFNIIIINYNSSPLVIRK